MPDIQNIALRHLTLSDKNVRTTRTKESIESLAANILANGLLQNLHVHTKTEGSYAVVVGGTRLAALQLLLKEKKITEDFQVACEVHPENDPRLAEISLSENVVRTAMHPADELVAFSKLIEEGKGPAEVGATYGKTGRYVEQRMRLAAVSPKLLAIFRKGEMTLDQLEAFTVEPDTRKQEKVWKSLNDWQRGNGRGETIRTALTEQKVETDDPRVRLVTLDAYKAAGGNVIQDLFDRDPDAGYLTDAALLDRLVGEKLEAEAAKLAGEGWKWSLAAPAMTYEEDSKFQRLHAKRAEPTDEAKAEIAKLEEEATRIQEEHGEQPEDDAAATRLDEIGERYNELIEGEEVWTAEQKAVAGVVVTIGQGGELRIRRGMVRPEDRAEARKLDPRAAKGTLPPANSAKAKGGLPAALITELTSHKTKAAQVELSGNPTVALKAVTHALTIRLFYDGYTDEHTSLGIKANEPRFPHAIHEDVEKSAPGKKLASAVKGWGKKLPKEPEQLWVWIEKQPKATVESLLAVCAAMTVDLVQVNGSEAKTSAGELTAAIKLDMADHWTATAENYFTRVPKKLLIAELGTAVSVTTKRSLEGMKRDQLGKTLTTELKGKKWLPSVMRAGKPGVS